MRINVNQSVSLNLYGRLVIEQTILLIFNLNFYVRLLSILNFCDRILCKKANQKFILIILLLDY